MSDYYWHFCPVDADGVPRLGNGDGREVRVGETLTVDGVIAPCAHGLHASEHVIDALKYASSRSALCRVTLGGTIMHDADKYVASERTVIAMLSAAETNALLREFARWCALQVIDLWDAPPVVRDYLETGDESLRAAASDAAWDAASAAAWDAAWDAAWNAAWAAAWDAAWDAQDEWLTAEALRRMEATP